MKALRALRRFLRWVVDCWRLAEPPSAPTGPRACLTCRWCRPLPADFHPAPSGSCTRFPPTVFQTPGSTTSTRTLSNVPPRSAPGYPVVPQRA